MSPKTVEDLAKSRAAKEQILRELGGFPESIMVHDKSDKAIDPIADERSYANQSMTKDNPEALEAFSMSGMSCRAGGLSKFPQNVGRMLLKFYAKKGCNVVDPFAGHNSRMEFCWRAGYNYYGSDLSHEFMKANFLIRDRLLGEATGGLFSPEAKKGDTGVVTKRLSKLAQTDMFGAPTLELPKDEEKPVEEVGGDEPGDAEPSTPTAKAVPIIELHEGDSRTLPWEDHFAQFTITSPPYWDLEYYGDEIGQLGKASYYEFLTGLEAVAAENFRCLSHKSFCVWCINDFRKDGKFYNYHGDVIKLMTRVGFTQWDMVVVDFGTSIKAAFTVQNWQQKIIPKRHEYWPVFRKIT